jgi:cytoskeletal protein RodZ
MKKLDDLFRQPLEPWEVPPPPDAWNRIEAGLAQRKSRIAWVRWAAAAAVAFSLTGMWWYFQAGSNHQTIALQQPAEGDVQSTPQAKALVTPALTEIAQINEAQPRTAQTTRRQESVKPKNPAPQSAPTALAAKTEAPPIITAFTDPAETPAAAGNDLPHQQADMPVVLTYFLPDVAPEEFTPERTAAKTPMKKIRAIALRIKHSEGWMGKIRAAKNDLFALDFRKDNETERNNY